MRASSCLLLAACLLGPMPAAAVSLRRARRRSGGEELGQLLSQLGDRDKATVEAASCWLRAGLESAQKRTANCEHRSAQLTRLVEELTARKSFYEVKIQAVKQVSLGQVPVGLAELQNLLAEIRKLMADSTGKPNVVETLKRLEDIIEARIERLTTNGYTNEELAQMVIDSRHDIAAALERELFSTVSQLAAERGLLAAYGGRCQADRALGAEMVSLRQKVESAMQERVKKTQVAQQAFHTWKSQQAQAEWTEQVMPAALAGVAPGAAVAAEPAALVVDYVRRARSGANSKGTCSPAAVEAFEVRHQQAEEELALQESLAAQVLLMRDEESPKLIGPLRELLQQEQVSLHLAIVRLTDEHAPNEVLDAIGALFDTLVAQGKAPLSGVAVAAALCTRADMAVVTKCRVIKADLRAALLSAKAAC